MKQVKREKSKKFELLENVPTMYTPSELVIFWNGYQSLSEKNLMIECTSYERAGIPLMVPDSCHV